MIKCLQRLIGVRLALTGLDHEVRNSTTCIRGVLAMIKCRGLYVRQKDEKEILFQLKRIEDALNFVQQLNKGQDD